MTHNNLIANLTMLAILVGGAQGYSQAIDTVQPAAPAPSAQQAQRIVTKDPEYLKLLNPSQGNILLQTYSKSYRDRSAEIEAKVAGISDDNLRNQTRNEEWIAAHQQDGNLYVYEVEVALREAKLLFSARHKDGWFEVGHIIYDENNGVLEVLPNPTSPIDAALRFPMKAATLNQIYEKFREIAGQAIDLKAHEYVANAQAGSNCSNFPDTCYKYTREDMEQKQRAARLEVVAEGSMESMEVDRILLVDSMSETILLDLTSSGSALSSAAWRFNVGPIPTMVVEKASSESVSDKTPSSETAASQVSAPANVVAASVVTKINAEYPAEARAKNIQGEVILHAIIDKDGNVSKIQVWSGDDLLSKAAVDAVRQWKYKPMLVDGEPKEVDTIITITFSLKE